MEPLLAKGTHLVADPDRKAESGNFVIVHFAGKRIACLKQIVMNGATWKLTSPNIKIIGKENQLTTKSINILSTIVCSILNF